MGGFSLWHWLVVGLVILLLFGRGRFSEMMGDVAKGLKNFKKGMAEDEDAVGQPPRQIARDGRDAPAVTSEPAAPARPLETPVRTELERDADRRA